MGAGLVSRLQEALSCPFLPDSPFLSLKSSLILSNVHPPPLMKWQYDWQRHFNPQKCFVMRLKPLSEWEVSLGDLELTRCKSTVRAICVGSANSANYPDQWSDATFIRCKLHCERGKLFLSLLGGAAYAAVSRDFWSVLHLRFYQRVYGCQSSVLSNSRVYISTSFIFQVSYSYFRICDNDEPRK